MLLSYVFMGRYLGAAVQNMSVGIDFSLVAALLDMVLPEGEQDVAVSVICVELCTACRMGFISNRIGALAIGRELIHM